jgi:glucose-6-phosphate 1-epimerase
MQATQPAILNQQFGIPGIAEITNGHGGLSRIVIKSAAAEGEIYLHGAHVTSWKPAESSEVLFMSRNSLFQDGKPIRGGVPVCFPWFGPNAANPKAPAHGFVRTRGWQVKTIEKSGDAVVVIMELTSDDETKKWWPADFRLLYRVTFGQELSLELILINTGSQPLTYEAALHTYYRIGDISKAVVEGLDRVHYIDKTDNAEEKIQRGTLTINKETDSVYLDTTGDVGVVDPVLRRKITVHKENSHCTVVWNPWIDKAKALADLGEISWPNMICVEACNVGPFAAQVAPGEQHSMKAITTLSAL